MTYADVSFEEDTGNGGRPSRSEEARQAKRAARATTRLLELLIQRHPNEPDWCEYSSRQIAQPGKPFPVPKIHQNPARSEQPHEKPAFEQLVGAGTCGAPSLEWVTVQDAIATPVVRLARTDRPKIWEIQEATARHYGVSRDDILASRRTAIIVRPRQVAMYLAKMLTLHSLPRIGLQFGGRDHTTILYSVRKTTELVLTDKALAADVAAIRVLLGVADGEVAG